MFLSFVLNVKLVFYVIQRKRDESEEEEEEEEEEINEDHVNHIKSRRNQQRAQKVSICFSRCRKLIPVM